MPLLPLTPREHRFVTLREAEEALTAQGFRLLPNSCTWQDESGLIDAGVYEEEIPSKSSYCPEYRYRIEYAA